MKTARIFKCGLRVEEGGPVPAGRLRGQLVVWGNPVSRPGGAVGVKSTSDGKWKSND
jgi:hypothetical protein